eukprot:TRINITY_DN11323_c0_g1_i2.p1 TRINITY_DN11323_c0_g1~~TRINITY_DN11323_c0_g1_i2.p1  ORF type:complete len:300 (+),score=69.14 TRINITY_DN11323_c0_g1_i2:46-900(+)
MEHSSSWTYTFGSPPQVYLNQDHPLLRIPQCIWPRMVPPDQEFFTGESERFRAWVAVLSTCHALRDYLLPLFIILNPEDYSRALEGYYIWSNLTRPVDYYLEITRENLTFTTKKSAPKGAENKKKCKSATWRMERKVLSPTKQQIVIITKAFRLDRHFEPEFNFDRFHPTGLELRKYTREKFNQHLMSFKSNRYKRCGAAVATPGDPCCHEAISDIARGVLQGIPRDLEGYNSIMLGMAVVVEELAQECMANAMTDIEIHEKILESIERISPGLTGTLEKRASQ